MTQFVSLIRSENLLAGGTPAPQDCAAGSWPAQLSRFQALEGSVLSPVKPGNHFCQLSSLFQSECFRNVRQGINQLVAGRVCQLQLRLAG